MSTVNEKPDGDFDPAAPSNLESMSQAGVEAANMGGGQEAPEAADVEAAPLGAIDIQIANARQFLTDCMTSNPRVGYGLGDKIRSGQVPGRDFKTVDCSGFVREAIRRSTNLGNQFPDGSVVQHDWVRAQRFEKGTTADGRLRDGAVRIAFLRPQDSPQRIGHVVLIHQSTTLESHGGVGPNSRAWDERGWQAKAFVYLLSAP